MNESDLGELKGKIEDFEVHLHDLITSYTQGDMRMYALILSHMTDYVLVALVETRGLEKGLELLSTRVNMITPKIKKLMEEQ